MAKPEYCPVLSTSPGFDEGSGSLKSGGLVKCKGTSCALFRKKDQSCALGDVATVGPETAEPVEVDTGPVLLHLEHMESLIAERDEGISGRLDELERKVGQDTHRFEEALTDLVQSLSKVNAAMEGFTRSSESFERLKAKMQGEQRVREDREEAVMRFREGLGHLRAGRASEGIRSLRRSVSMGDAAPAEATAALGAGLLMAGETKDAISQLERAAEQDPSAPAPRANLAHAFALIRKWDAAEATAHEAIRLDPKCGAAWNTLGNALYAQGRSPEAISAWERAVDADPGLDAAWENLKRQHLVCTDPE